MSQHVGEFDLHGIVGVRVEGTRSEDVGAVARQLGPIASDLDREPDISIRFVDRLRTGPLTYVGVGDSAYDGDSFYVIRRHGERQWRTRLPFDAVGGPMQIVCERGLPAVPHLLSCINIAALGRDVLPLHASAYELDGRGVLVMGWAKGGKTEALLGAMERGARYIGDEWVYLSGTGEMYGLPEPIRLWAWHLAQFPDVVASRSLAARSRLTTWRGLSAAARGLARTDIPFGSVARRAHPVLERQAYLQVPPAELFGPDRLALRGRLDAAVLMLSRENGASEVRQADPGEVAGRMAASLVHERQTYLDRYQQFLFAFPTRRNDALDTAAEREARLLQALFDSRQTAVVAHPYPCSIPALAEAVSSAVAPRRVPRQRQEATR